MRESFSVSAYKLVMFDLDGTLVDSALDLHVALNRALSEHAYPSVVEAQTRVWVGNGAEVLVNRALFQALDVEEKHHDLSSVLDSFYRCYDEVNGKYARLYTGALALVSSLRDSGCKVAVVTNKPEKPAADLLRVFGIEVDALIGGDTTNAKKPDPTPLRHCMKLFSAESRDSVLVGDSVNDFSAASAAGIAAVGVSYGYNHGMPIDPSNLAAFVDSLEELR